MFNKLYCFATIKQFTLPPSTLNDRDYVDEESNKKEISLTVSQLTLVLKTAHDKNIRFYTISVRGTFKIGLGIEKKIQFTVHNKRKVREKKIEFEKMNFLLIKVVLIVCLFKTIRSIPLNANGSSDGRIYFDAVTNWIMDTEWLPVEVNVPDTISGMIGGMQNAWTATMGYFGVSPPPRIKMTGKKLLRMVYLFTML